MQKRLLIFIKTYLILILVFALQKPLFMIFYRTLYAGTAPSDWLAVLLHGLKLDASMAGYLTVLPGIFLIFSVWMNPSVMKHVFRIYYGFISVFMSVVFVADIALYGYWGFRLDSTPLFYLRQPKDAMASADWVTMVVGVLSVVIVALSLYYVFRRFLIDGLKNDASVKNKIARSFALLVATFLLFIPIRGGFTVSTMNVGKVYFSEKMELNHAAINPMFSLMESLMQDQNFGKQYRFMKADEAAKEFAGVVEKSSTDSVPQLFTVKRPNVIFIVLESFMSKVVEPLGGEPGVAPRLNGFCSQGVLFSHCFANSFRTDRGLVAIFSGYPAQPTTSIMKYPAKSQSLPSIPKSLKKAGYNLQYYYGGDADFTNMRSYLMSQGIEKIVSDKNFPAKDRQTKWGAPDHVVFNRLTTDLEGGQKEPFMKIFQTLSSHEPFDIPTRKLANPYLNSVAYTDSCLGAFVDRFKKTKYWKNTVIVLVPDHCMRYPKTLDNRSVERHKIPLLMIGGAVKQARVVDTYAGQIDIAATLLAQLNLPHSDFTFSKNVLNPSAPHFGYFTFPNGFGMVTPSNTYVYDCESNTVVSDTGAKGQNKKRAEALLQTLYDDLDRR